MRKYIKPIIALLVSYFAILVLLVVVESNASGASIRTIWDAMWYSIITVTTIGYGDYVPVTAFGKALGIVFAICSIGFLTTLISLSLKILTGELLPSIQMYRKRNVTWHIFEEESEESLVLINDFLSSEKDSLIIVNSAKKNNHANHRIIYCDMSLSEIIEKKKDPKTLNLFFLGNNELENYSKAKDTAELGIDSYFKSNNITEVENDNMHLVNVAECISRTYWRKHPLTKESIIVMIGCGDVGCALLEKALITNISKKELNKEYHVFGNSQKFAACHCTIVKALSELNDYDDSLYFHHDDWIEYNGLLAAADRIIICEDDELKNIQIYQSIAQWFPTHASIHLLSSKSFPGATVFGDAKEVFTKPIVMKDELNKCAEMLNDIYNKDSENPTAWKDLSSFLKQSNITAADHILVKIRYLLNDDSIVEVTEENCTKAYNEYCSRKDKDADVFQEMEHRRWVRFHQLYNWTFGETKNALLREHPCLVPYAELTEADKQKDAYAWELLGSLAKELSNNKCY